MRRFLLATMLLAACGDDPAPATERSTIYGGDRYVKLDVPVNFDETRAYPLVLVLHGYTASGFAQKAYFGTHTLLEAGDAFVLAPDGTVDSSGAPFWNADPACCDFDHTGVDDVAYLGGLLDAVTADWPIDRARVYAWGHSNGGFMAYRMACERADMISAIAVLAGVQTTLPCNPTQPVSVLHMHGTADDMVPFSAAQPSVEAWAGLDHCGSTQTTGPSLDLEDTLAGAETSTHTTDGCAAPVGIEEWVIDGGSHLPSFVPAWGRMVFDWLSAHGRVP